MADGKSGLLHNAEAVTADWTSDEVLVLSRAGIAFHIHIENTNLVGEVVLEGHLDPDTLTDLEWIPIQAETIHSGINNNIIFDEPGTGIKFLRVIVDWTSGAGTITVMAHQVPA